MRARREFVDALTGEPRTRPGPGIRETGKFVARVKPGQVLEVPADAVLLARGTFPIAPEALEDLQRRADEQAKPQRKADKPPKVATTFDTAAEAAKLFMRGNAAFIDAVTLGDPIDVVRDWMAPIRVYQGGRTAAHAKKLADTPAGRAILDELERRHVGKGIAAALRWIFGQAKGRRWANVPWFEVDRLGDALLERCGDEAREWDEASACTGWLWWPPGSGVTPAAELLRETLTTPGDHTATITAAEATRLGVALTELEKAYTSARKCLPKPTQTLIRRRISYLKQLHAEPHRIARSAICGPDPTTGHMVCGFPALEAEARRIGEACELPYHPEWPRVAALSDDEREALGIEPDLGRSVTQAEREGVPNPKGGILALRKPPPKPKAQKFQFSTEPGAYRHRQTLEPLTYIEHHETGRPVRVQQVDMRTSRGVRAFLPGDFEPAAPEFGLYGERGETPSERQRREMAARAERGRQAQAATVQTSLDIDLEPEAKQRSLFNPSGNPWGKLVDLKSARVIELHILRPDGKIACHVWGAVGSRPHLFWSESKRALLFVHGGEAPARTDRAPPTGPEARRYRQFAGRSARGEAAISIPSGPLQAVGQAVRIVYSSDKYRDGVPRHHDFGPGVRVRAGSPGVRRLWAISGGRLTVTSRGLVG